MPAAQSGWSVSMLARIVLGAVTAGALVAPAFAGMMTADEARKFVAGKIFVFNCFDGTRGACRILDDMGAAGAVQFSGSGPIRHVRYLRFTCGAAPVLTSAAKSSHSWSRSKASAACRATSHHSPFRSDCSDARR